MGSYDKNPVMLTLVDTGMPAFRPAPINDAEATAVFRAVLNLFRHWGVTDDQAAGLLDLSRRTFARWKAQAGKAGETIRIGRDGKARLSNLIGIHKALRILFHEPARGYAWIKAPNAAFGGQSALEVMLCGELTDIMRVRRYLDAERGGW